MSKEGEVGKEGGGWQRRERLAKERLAMARPVKEGEVIRGKVGKGGRGQPRKDNSGQK